MAWVAYGVAWLTFALLWALAGASSSGTSPIEALPYGLLAMGLAALMGVGIWRMTGRVPLDWRTRSFYLHVPGLAAFCGVYATSWMWPDLVTGRGPDALEMLRASPVLLWNLLMGSWLYLMIGGVSYAVRAEHRLRAEAASAAEARLLAQQAQLAALKAQINPHFLFNALHSVGALVAIDPARADAALERLGDLLRYALDAENEVTLDQEWRFTHDYLSFEQLRLGDRLAVEAQMDPSAAVALVPPLVLQTLVENAVRHGVSPRPDGGRVEIDARIEGQGLVLSVANRGGRDVERSGGGLGLELVRRRLQALHGERARVHVEDAVERFVVTVRLPYRRAGDLGSAA